jgi:hypothetical protein
VRETEGERDKGQQRQRARQKEFFCWERDSITGRVAGSRASSGRQTGVQEWWADLRMRARARYHKQQQAGDSPKPVGEGRQGQEGQVDSPNATLSSTDLVPSQFSDLVLEIGIWRVSGGRGGGRGRIIAGRTV